MSWRGGVVEANGRRLSLVRTYGDVDTGSAAALVGSSGLVEIAVRDGSAAALLGLTRGSAVVLRPS
jgi:S-adenosylmethionine hydrolase